MAKKRKTTSHESRVTSQAIGAQRSYADLHEHLRQADKRVGIFGVLRDEVRGKLPSAARLAHAQQVPDATGGIGLGNRRRATVVVGRAH